MFYKKMFRYEQFGCRYEQVGFRYEQDVWVYIPQICWFLSENNNVSGQLVYSHNLTMSKVAVFLHFGHNTSIKTHLPYINLNNSYLHLNITRI